METQQHAVTYNRSDPRTHAGSVLFYDLLVDSIEGEVGGGNGGGGGGDGVLKMDRVPQGSVCYVLKNVGHLTEELYGEVNVVGVVKADKRYVAKKMV